MASRKTGFDKFVGEQMKRPRFKAAYGRARAEIAAVDDLIRALDEKRIAIGMTKVELARRISASPEVVRRLLTAGDANPTMETVLRIAHAVGLRLALEPAAVHGDQPKRGERSKRHGTVAA